MIIDQQSDKSQKFLHRAVGDLVDAEFGKQVCRLAGASTEKVASDEFALPIQRKFPLHTPNDTVLSKVYYDAQKDDMPAKQAAEIGNRIDTYLNLYDIPEAVFARRKKTASSRFKPRYMLPEFKLCKVAGVDSLRQAGELFDREHDKLPIARRLEFASNYVNTARELNLSAFPTAISKYAGLLESDTHRTSELLRLRAVAANRIGKDGTPYEKLADILEKPLPRKPSRKSLLKLAELIDTLDLHSGLSNPKYSKRIPCPFTTTFNKAAEDPDVVKSEPTDNTDLEGLTKADIIAQYGEGVLDAVETEDGEIDRKALAEVLRLRGGGKHESE